MTGEDLNLINLENGEIVTVGEFQYLCSLIASSGRTDPKVEQEVAKASNTFRTMRKALFHDKNLRPSTKRRSIMPACCQCCYMGKVLGSS